MKSSAETYCPLRSCFILVHTLVYFRETSIGEIQITDFPNATCEILPTKKAFKKGSPSAEKKVPCTQFLESWLQAFVLAEGRRAVGDNNGAGKHTRGKRIAVG
jgi:hypothetical protein